MVALLVYLPAALFLLLLAGVHLDDPDAYRLPLSNFRDGPQAVAGYLLFVLLLVIGYGQARLFVACGRQDEIVFIVVCQLLLVAVAVTPTLGCVHGFASFALMFLLFCFYGTRLLVAESPWLVPHVAVPVVLCVGTCLLGEYGPGQKGLIVYFVLCIVVDCARLQHLLAETNRKLARRGKS